MLAKQLLVSAEVLTHFDLHSSYVTLHYTELVPCYISHEWEDGLVSQENLSPGNCVAATVFPQEIMSLTINVATVYPKEILSSGNTVAPTTNPCDNQPRSPLIIVADMGGR